jgi:hypothetical protein
MKGDSFSRNFRLRSGQMVLVTDQFNSGQMVLPLFDRLIMSAKIPDPDARRRGCQDTFSKGSGCCSATPTGNSLSRSCTLVRARPPKQDGFLHRRSVFPRSSTTEIGGAHRARAELAGWEAWKIGSEEVDDASCGCPCQNLHE